MEGFDHGFFEGRWGIGSFQIQEPAQLLYGSAMGTPLEFFYKRSQPRILSKKGLFLRAWTRMSSLTVKGGMVSLGGDSGFSFIQKPGMVGHLLVFEEDLYPVPQLMDFHLLPDKPFRYRVAVGIHRHIAGHIHRSIKSLIDRWEVRRKGMEVGFFHQVGGFRAHAQGAFNFLVGNLCAPSFGLLVKVLPIRERATRQKISFQVGKVSLYFCLPVWIADDMGDKRDPEDMAEAFYLRGNVCLRATAVSHQDARIVDDTPRAGAAHELKGRIEKDPGLEAGEGRVILGKKSSGVSEDQARTLGLPLLFP